MQKVEGHMTIPAAGGETQNFADVFHLPKPAQLGCVLHPLAEASPNYSLAELPMIGPAPNLLGNRDRPRLNSDITPMPGPLTKDRDFLPKI